MADGTGCVPWVAHFADKVFFRCWVALYYRLSRYFRGERRTEVPSRLATPSWNYSSIGDDPAVNYPLIAALKLQTSTSDRLLPDLLAVSVRWAS